MKSTIVVSLLLVAPVAVGAPWLEFSLVPDTPFTGDTVNAHVRTQTCTLLPPEATIVRDGNTVRVELEIPDFCSPPDVVPERIYALGSFDPGRYQVELYSCGNPPPTQPRCSLVQSLNLGVAGPQQAIPALDRRGQLLCVSLTLLLAVWQLGRTRK